MTGSHPQRKFKLRRYPWVAAVDDPHTQSGAVGDMAHGPVLAPVGPQAPPRRPLRLRVDTRYADGGAPPMDYRDDHLRRVSAEKRLACPHKVEPAVQRQVVKGRAAPFPDRGKAVMVRMCHWSLPQNCSVWVRKSVKRSLCWSVIVRSGTEK